MRTVSSFIFFMLLSLPSVQAGRWDRQGAIRAFEEAGQKQNLLRQEPQPDLSRYLECARIYRKVYMSDPHYAHSPDAVYEEGMLYQEIGDKYKDPRYYRIAARRFQFLVSDYPGNPNCPDALQRLVAIFHRSLNDRDAAQESYQILKLQYKDARSAITLAEEELAQATASAPAAPAAADTPAAASALVRNIRCWSTSEYTRVMIDMDVETSYSKSSLSNPDRIYFDISNSRLSGDFLNRTIAVDDQILEQIRVGQNHPDIVRVVLDIKTGYGYTVSELHDPFRIVVDFKHSSAATARSQSKLPASDSRLQEEENKGRIAPADRSAAAVRRPPTTAAEKKEKPAAKAYAAGKGEPPAAVVEVASTTPGEVESAPALRTKVAAKDQTSAVDSGAASAARSADLPPSSILPASRNNKVAANPETKLPSETKPDRDALPKAAAPTSRGDRTLTRMLGLKVGRIVIDPGHGGHDLGTVGPGGLVEKDLVLSLALRLKKLIEENMYGEVILTRSDDTFVSLEDRTAVANSHHADLFISIHANSSRYRSISGAETYYLDFAKTASEREVAARENATAGSTVSDLESLVMKIAQADKSAESRELASLMQKSLYSDTRKLFPSARDRGVRKAPFVVLIGANMPSVLAEVAFLSNPKDERTLNKDANQDSLAKALFTGIESYIKTLGSSVAQNQRNPK